MRTALCFVFALALAVPALAGTNEYVIDGATPIATDGTFVIEFEFGIDFDSHCVGVGFDGQYIWVSAGDYTTGLCQFHIYDDTGGYLGSIPQGAGATGWGHRDLCFDGTYMYGSFNTQIHAFDVDGNYAGFFNGPGISPCRALAYDGHYFYTCGFSEYIYRGHWDGVWGSTPDWQIISGETIAGCYGMAYDCDNNCLWITTANYTGDLLQYTTDGLPVGVHTTLPEYDIQGGCQLAATGSYGTVLLVIQQSAPDMVTFYDVNSFCAVEETSWSCIKSMFQ